MNRLPSELRRTPPSPRTDSVTRMPFTEGGQTIPVGWNWMNSMLRMLAPARRASPRPSPVYSQEFEVTLNDLPMPPGGEDDGRGAEDDEPAGLAPVADGAADPLAVEQQVGDGQLGEDLQPRLQVAGLGEVVLLQRHDLLLERADELQAGAVADVREPRVLVPAEVALRDAAVGGAVEQRAVGLQLPDPLRRLLRVQLGHPRVVEELAAAQGVAEVDLPAVLGVDVAHRRRDAALGHDGVRLAEQRLADDRGAQPLLAGLDGRPQAGATRTDHQDVVVVLLQVAHVVAGNPSAS